MKLLRRFNKNKKGSVLIALAFFISITIVILISSIFAPMGVLFTAEMYVAGQDILAMSNDTIAEINDTEVRDRILAVVDSAYEASEVNIEVNSHIYQYGWVYVLIISAMVAFIAARFLVEFGRGRGGGIA